VESDSRSPRRTPAWIADTPGVDSTRRTSALSDSLKRVKQGPSLHYRDRYGDPYSDRPFDSPLRLKDPGNVKTEVQVDTAGNVTIQEKVGEFDYRPPTTLNRDEFSSYQDGFLSREYWRSKAEGEKGKSEVTGRRLIPKIYLGPSADRLFGGSYLDFQTNGFVTLDFGAQWQATKNPNLPVRQQRQFMPLNFDQQMSINFTGKLGEKLKMTGNFDSKASFQFEQNLKLEYTGFEEDIIQKIEAGNVSMPLNSTLITGAQNLFGLKTQLRFGRLQVTSILANQRAQLDEVRVQGGAQRRRFEIRASDYEENRHFLLGQFFRNNYEPALRSVPVTGGYSPRSSGTIPATANNTINNANNPNGGANPEMGGGDFGGGTGGMGGAGGMNNGMINGNQNSIGGSSVNSGVNITRIEVYVTNRANNTQTLRNLIAFTDLGEGDPSKKIAGLTDNGLGVKAPIDNGANGLYGRVENNPEIRSADRAGAGAEALGMVQGIDYEVLRGARQLSPQEYTFQPQLGYISLNTPIGRDEIIAVAFEYTLNGRRFKVGELTEDYQTRPERETIILKLIRPAAVRTDLPTWNLMMKNIYSLGAGQINREGFQLRVIYKDDLTGIDNPSLQEGRYTKDVPLLQVFNLDRLNPQGDPQPDGNFDWVEGVTIDSRAGRIIFPVLEPFGSHLTNDDGRATTQPPPPWFDPQTEQALVNKYVFSTLYNNTRQEAQQIAEKNKFFLKGTYQGTASNDVQLPTFGADAGAVSVTLGGVPLVQGQDYILENGQVRIINEGISQSNGELVINYEKPDLFNNQIRTLMGTRLDYLISKDFVIGSTLMRLKERPIISRVGMGNEPTNNTVFGLDANFKKDSRLLTRLVDKLPLIQTKELSGITFTGEYARLFPAVASGARGNSFIDDFEGAETPFDLTRIPQVNWKLGATPLLFPEAKDNTLGYSFRRAKIAWYTVDNTFYREAKPGGLNEQDLRNHFVRQVLPQEIFPNRAPQQVNMNENLMNIAYYPSERGMYNYNPAVDAQGNLTTPPQQNWAALTRAIRSDIDFDNANVQYIEFWVMDPFKTSSNGLYNIEGQELGPGAAGGDVYFNLGNISEDVLKDGRHAFENGLPINDDPNNRADTTRWGQVPGTQFLTNAFENTSGARGRQDVGLDGLTNAGEAARFGSSLADPSGDDFKFFLDPQYDAVNAKPLDRYKNFNGMEGNSPEAGGSEIARSATTYPDNEDLNQDNTVSNLESYFQYKVSMRPNDLAVGRNYIVAKRDTIVHGDNVTWYQFRIPVREYTSKEGNIENFKSIRFMRMFLTNWSQPVVLRLAQYQLVANQWRIYGTNGESLEEPDANRPPERSNAQFTLGTVNIEENSGRTNPVPYQIPPGFIRDRDITTINNRLLNEQSLRMCVEDLRDGDARAAFKTVTLDFINYKRIRMFLHAETGERFPTASGEVTAFLRLGTDYTENYYEIEKELVMTEVKTGGNRIYTDREVWPEENEIDFPFQELINVKSRRNERGISVLLPYTDSVIVATDGVRHRYRVRVVGNPDLSSVQIIMLGVRNPATAGAALPKSVCIWANELRVTDFDQESGWAATGRLNIKLADFATLSASARHTTYGFGGIQDRISERARENTTRWDATANVNLDKLLPTGWGLKVPLFVGYERERIRPRFNPLDPDVQLEQSIASRFVGRTSEEERAYREIVEDNTTRRSLNFSNIQKVRQNPDAKAHLWDIENLSLSYAYSDIVTTNVTTARYYQKNQRGGLAYAYNLQPKFIEPFKNFKFLDNPWLKWLQEFNFALTPSSIGVRGDLDRSFTKTQYRNSDLTTRGILPLYEKFFTFNRIYDLRWNLARNLSLDYTATANAVIDEPRGDIDDTEINPLTDSLLIGSGYTRRDSLIANIKRLGRMKQFQQRAALTYRLPFDKFVLTDWLNADVRYAAGYQWTAAPFGVTDTLGLSFGNIAQNNRERAVNGQINLTRLYNKVKFLKEINEARPPAARAGSDSTRPQAPERPRIAVQDTARKKPEFKILKGVLRALMTARNLNFNYQIDETTLLPGLLTTPKYFGVDEATLAPGLGFALWGSQDDSVRYRLAEQGLYSKSKQLNNPFVQTFTESFSARTDLEPFRDFKIRLDVKRNYSQYYTELFRSAIDSARFDLLTGTYLESFQSQSPNLSGDYNISFLSIKTFLKGGGEGPSPVFEQFDTNRYAIQNRLELTSGGDAVYNINSQDVLIPAFLAAYSGKDAGKVGLSPFPRIPLPNWRVDYAGLSRLEAFRKIFSSFNLQHSYTSNYSVRNFISSLEYTNPADVGLNPRLRYPTPSITSDSGYVPVYVMSQVVISERFAPLIGVEARTLSRITARLQYNAERIVALNLSNRQVQELRSRDVTASIGFTRNNTRLPFKTQGRNVVLKNDLQFRCDATVRDTRTVQRKLEGTNTSTAGGLNFQFKPTINYVVNQRLNLQGYFERTVNSPHITSSFPNSTTRFGFNLRYSLSE